MSPSITPFDEIKYRNLMNGLEISEIRLQELERTSRIDAEFYKKENLATSSRLYKTNFFPVTDFFTISDGNHMSISEDFQETGIPYYRGQDIYNVFIEESSPICIDETTYNHPHMLRSHLRSGDVLMSIVGAIVGNSAIVSSNQPATCSCKLAIIRSKNKGLLPEFLLIYIKTKYGQNQIQKFKRGAAQTGFLLEDFNQIFVPLFSENLQNEIKRLVRMAHKAIVDSDQTYKEAEQSLLSKINYHSAAIGSESISIKSFKSSFLDSGRLDAEYYQPKYDINLETIKSVPFRSLGGDNGIVDIKKSIEPGSAAYQEDGIPFVRVSDISQFGIITPEIHIPKDFVNDIENLFPKKDTILLSKDGTVGIAYKVEEDLSLITSSALLHLQIRSPEEILPDYLSLVLNSPITQLQAKRGSSGAIIQHWKISDIENVIIPVLDISTQRELSENVQKSFTLRHRSQDLLIFAQETVAMAIEQGENIALKWLEDIVNQ